MMSAHWFTMTLLLLAHPWAGAEPLDQLTPFRAEYTLQYHGLPFKAKGVRQLTMDATGQYQFTSDATSIVAKVHEASLFRIADGEVIPSLYRYKQSGLGRNKTRETAFDWSQMTADHGSGNLDLVDGLQDKLSYQVQLRLTIASLCADGAKDTPVRLLIADEEEIKSYEFELAGEEIIDTPAGAINTLRVERVHGKPDRSTTFWLAVDHELLLVKLVQQDDDRGFELNLEGFEWH